MPKRLLPSHLPQPPMGPGTMFLCLTSPSVHLLVTSKAPGASQDAALQGNVSVSVADCPAADSLLDSRLEDVMENLIEGSDAIELRVDSLLSWISTSPHSAIGLKGTIFADNPIGVCFVP